MQTTREIAVKSIKEMQTALEALPWEDPRCYALWLAQTYYYVRHATRVLCKAAWRCSMDEEPLHKNLIQGVHEEKNHEIMATSDLAHLGFKISDFPEIPGTTAYYQTLYHQIDTEGPYALLGYFLTLEGLGAIGCDQIYDRILKAHGDKCIQFVHVHARLDKRHFDEGIAAIADFPKEKLEIIHKTIAPAAHFYIQFLKEIGAQYEQFTARATRAAPAIRSTLSSSASL